jgi:uncharacterized protein (DUF885 family)
MPIPTGTRPFDRLAAELLEDQLAAEPNLGTFLGITDHDDRVADKSAAAIVERHRREDVWLQRFEALDDELDLDERIDRDLVVMVLRGRQVMRDWEGWRRSPDDYAGSVLTGLQLLLLNRDADDSGRAAALAARLRRAPELLAQGRTNLEAELAAPELVERGVGMARAGAGYARSIAGLVPGDHRVMVAEAGESAGAAFDDFAAFLEGLAEKATGDWAIGEARYDALLRYAEGLGYGAREMRQRGIGVWQDLADDLRRRTRELCGDDDWRALLDDLDRDHPPTPEAMLAGYQTAAAAARAFCLENELVTLPQGESCQVLPSEPFTRPVIAVAHYMAPPPFADRPRRGTFYVPFPPDGATEEQIAQRMATNAYSSQWTITAHEAYPGHHWHMAHLAAHQRRPLRYVFSSAYFTEGWGLYAEEMMKEQGFFTDPRAELRQVDMRLFRAARIVVDTSLHLGEMTIDEATEHMSTRASLSPDTARAEVLRYCAWPTQAASYLTGSLEIQRMRDEWLHQARGSLRDFHDLLAGTGRLPISLVETYLAETAPRDG